MSVDGPLGGDPAEALISRAAFLKLTGAGALAGGLALGGTNLASAAAAMRSFQARSALASLAGKRVAISYTIIIEILIEFWQSMENEAAAPGNGEKITKFYTADSVAEHAAVSAMIEQDYDAIFLEPASVFGWDSAVAQAKKKGIGIFSHSGSPIGGILQNVGLDQQGAGYSLGQVAAAWNHKYQGGTGQWALLDLTNDPQLILRGVGVRAAMKKYAPNAKLVGDVFAQLEATGASAAANLLQAHPNLSMILSAGDDPGLGALTSATGAGKTNPHDFFIGSCDGTDAVLAKIKEGGIYQAVSDFLFPFSSTQCERDIEKFLRGMPVQPTRVVTPVTVTASNLAHWQKVSANPLAPDVQYIYKDYFHWSNVALKTNEPYVLTRFPRARSSRPNDLNLRSGGRIVPGSAPTFSLRTVAYGEKGEMITTQDGTPSAPLVRCVGIAKFFGGVQALADVSLDLHAGERVCLVGDNGAGKSTLAKILSGMVAPDEGSVWIDDRPVRLTRQHAREVGIEAVYQDLALCNPLGAVANVMLGQEPIRFRLGPLRFINRPAARAETERCMREIGIELDDLDTPVYRLSGGQRQAVAIARATVRAHRLILFDEPTAALGVRQTASTLALVRRVAEKNVAVVMVSHNLDDVFAVADRIVALRLGRITLDTPVESTSREEVVACMTGLATVPGYRR